MTDFMILNYVLSFIGARLEIGALKRNGDEYCRQLVFVSKEGRETVLLISFSSTTGERGLDQLEYMYNDVILQGQNIVTFEWIAKEIDKDARIEKFHLEGKLQKLFQKTKKKKLKPGVLYCMV